MASFFRWQIAHKVSPFIENTKLSSAIISSFVKVNRKSRKNPEFHLRWNRITKTFPNIENSLTPSKLVRLLKNQGLPTAEGIVDIELIDSSNTLTFAVDKHVFSKIVLSDICTNEEDIKKSSCLFVNIPTQKVFVFSSIPTVGEIFTVNDFRRILHSNFIANLHKFIGNDVQRVYHMPDWTSQTALLLVGYKHFGQINAKHTNRVKHLKEVLKAASFQYENEFNFRNEVDSCFETMNKNTIGTSTDWEYLKESYTEQYEALYKQVGLILEDICFDSSCHSKIREVYEELIDKQIICLNRDGCVTVNLPGEEEIEYNPTNPTIFYLCRLIHAFKQAKEINNSDLLYYISSSSEKPFFQMLYSVAKKLGCNWLDQLHHLPLGDITTFDSTQTSYAPADEVIKKAKTVMLKQMKENLYLEKDESLDKVAEILSYSCMHLFNMKHKRNISYSIRLEEMVNFGKDSGSAFQLCHAGLKGVQEETEFIFGTDVDTSPLLEPEAQNLILHLSRFDEVIHKSYLSLEPCYLHQYLSSLWYFTDRASNKLKLDIKSDRLTVIKARLMLLSATMKIFQKSLKLLGVEPYVNEYTQPSIVENTL